MSASSALSRASVKRQRTERFLSTLERYQPISRSELASLLGMSPASVTRAVNALIGLGLVREVSVTGSAGRGRRAINLHTCAGGMFSLGFHIAPDSLHGCLLDFDHGVRVRRVIPVPPSELTPERLAALAGEMAASLLPAGTSLTRAAGVSVSGQIDMDTGRVLRSEAFDWTDADIASPFGEALGMPVRVENDVKACLTWECLRRGYLENQRDVSYLYIGRAGVGFASSVGGQLVRGATNAAGEIEDILLSANERIGDRLMENSLVARARRLSPSVNTFGDILEASQLGIRWARMLADDFAGSLNLLLALVFALLDPHEIILGGDIADTLREYPGIVRDGRCAFGGNYEDACAHGVAFIAMRQAALDLMDAMSEETP